MPHDHDHDHDHDHPGHDHDHDHDHHGHHHGVVRTEPTRALAIATALNVAFVVVEVIGGLWAGSLALLADAAHNLGDVLGLLLAWGAMRLARRQPSRRRTFGLRKSTVLAALGNAMLILIAVGGISWEAIGRLVDPGEVAGTTVIWVAAIGVAINLGSALGLRGGHAHDVNVRAAFMHLMADAAVSVVVVITGVVLLFTDWWWLDPAISLLVGVVILFGTWNLLREALDLALDAVPAHIDPVAVEARLAHDDQVVAVHDLHIWAMSTTEVALTAHLVVRDVAACSPGLVHRLSTELAQEFGIGHATLQLESEESAIGCEPCEVAGT